MGSGTGGGIVINKKIIKGANYLWGMGPLTFTNIWKIK